MSKKFTIIFTLIISSLFLDFFRENPNLPLKKNVLATNSNIHSELKELINEKDIE